MGTRCAVARHARPSARTPASLFRSFSSTSRSFPLVLLSFHSPINSPPDPPVGHPTRRCLAHPLLLIRVPVPLPCFLARFSFLFSRFTSPLFPLGSGLADLPTWAFCRPEHGVCRLRQWILSLSLSLSRFPSSLLKLCPLSHASWHTHGDTLCAAESAVLSKSELSSVAERAQH